MNFETCTICNSRKLVSIKTFSHAYLVKCTNCNFIFSHKKATIEELTKHYTNYPRYDSLSPITEKRYNELLDQFEPFRKTNNMIDLGCSNGLFLECAKKRGWNVHGTEFAEECINACKKKGIVIYKSDQLPKDLLAQKFDVVTSFEVIEHINTPNEEIELIKSLLRSGGVFYFTTPNFNSISKYLLKEKWNIVEYPEHLSYFTPKTINYLLKKHGFKKSFISTTGISLSRFKQSIGKSEESRTTNNNTDEILRDKLENNGFLFKIKQMINFKLNLFKIGDAMKGLYIKP
ncbi:MAG: methyltransferase domain-containing protein [Bacteroidia bacterium]|nr:methyltransferase domain-containing protein [Bacteroidia bacterium]